MVNAYAVSGAHDYRELANRPDVLTFDSAPLERDTEVTGPIHAQIYFSCDCRDTDLWVRLLDVAPDGTAFNLMSPGLDVLRASYRDPEERPAIAQAGSDLSVASRQPDYQQCFSERASHSRASLGHIFPEFLTQSAHRRSRSPRPHECRRQTYLSTQTARRPSRVVLPISSCQ